MYSLKRINMLAAQIALFASSHLPLLETVWTVAHNVKCCSKASSGWINLHDNGLAWWFNYNSFLSNPFIYVKVLHPESLNVQRRIPRIVCPLQPLGCVYCFIFSEVRCGLQLQLCYWLGTSGHSTLWPRSYTRASLFSELAAIWTWHFLGTAKTNTGTSCLCSCTEELCIHTASTSTYDNMDTSIGALHTNTL